MVSAKSEADRIPPENALSQSLRGCSCCRYPGTKQSKLEYPPIFSDNLRFIDLKVLNPKVSPNTDGLDPESCKNVEIVGVYFLWEMTVLLLKPENLYGCKV